MHFCTIDWATTRAQKLPHIHLSCTAAGSELFTGNFTLQLNAKKDHKLFDLLLHSSHSLGLRALKLVCGAAEVAQHIVALVVKEDVFHLPTHKTRQSRRARCTRVVVPPFERREAAERVTFRSLWMMGVLRWCSWATASQVSQKICSTSASVKPVCSRWFIRLTT